MEFEEGLIPDYIWKFVRGIIKNPVTAGILAFIIWSYIKNKTKKKETLKVYTNSELKEILLLEKYKQSLTKEQKNILNNSKTKEEIYKNTKGWAWGVCHHIAKRFLEISPNGRVLEISGNYGRFLNKNKINDNSNHMVFCDNNDIVYDPMNGDKLPLLKYLYKYNIKTKTLKQKIESLKYFEINGVNEKKN